MLGIAQPKMRTPSLAVGVVAAAVVVAVVEGTRRATGATTTLAIVSKL